MKTRNGNFTEIQHLKESKHTWRHYLGYGTTVYDFFIGGLVGAALIGILSTFGFHIELWPTYIILGVFAFIYLVSNITTQTENDNIANKKENKLEEVITQEDIESWEARIKQLPQHLLIQDPISQPATLEKYVTERSISDTTKDMMQRYQKILDQLNAILAKPTPIDLNSATALKDAKIRASCLLTKLEKKLTWLADVEKNHQTKNQLRTLLGKPALADNTKKTRGYLTRSFGWLARYNQTIFYGSASGLYIYGYYFSGYAIPALFSWVGVFIFSVALLGGAFGLILDSIPSARKTHLEQIKSTKVSLQSKSRLLQFSVDCCEALADLKQINQDFEERRSTSLDPAVLKPTPKSNSTFRFIEIDRVERKSWLSYLYLDRAIEWLLAMYSGFGSGAAMYTLLPAALAVIPWLSLTFSIGLGIYYTLFRESQIRAMKTRESHLIDNLFHTLAESKTDLWQFEMQIHSFGVCKDEKANIVSIDEYIKRSKPDKLYTDLKKHYSTLKNHIQTFSKRASKIIDPHVKEAYERHKQHIDKLNKQLKDSLSLRSMNMKTQKIADFMQYDLLENPVEAKPKTTWWTSIKNFFSAISQFIGSNYQNFLDGATLGSSIVAIYLIGSGYAEILTLAASAIWLCGTFIGSGLAYLAIKLMIMESNEGYHNILREARDDIKTKSELMDSQLINHQFQLKILEVIESFNKEETQILQNVLAENAQSPVPQPKADSIPPVAVEPTPFNPASLVTLRQNFQQFMSGVVLSNGPAVVNHDNAPQLKIN